MKVLVVSERKWNNCQLNSKVLVNKVMQIGAWQSTIDTKIWACHKIQQTMQHCNKQYPSNHEEYTRICWHHTQLCKASFSTDSRLAVTATNYTQHFQLICLRKLRIVMLELYSPGVNTLRIKAFARFST